MIYDLVNDLAKDLMCTIYDTELKPVFISKSHKEILGYDPSDFSTNTLKSLIHPHDLAFVESQFSEIKEKNITAEITFRFKHQNGKWVTLCSKVKPYMDNNELKYFLITSFIKEKLFKMIS